LASVVSDNATSSAVVCNSVRVTNRCVVIDHLFTCFFVFCPTTFYWIIIIIVINASLSINKA